MDPQDLVKPSLWSWIKSLQPYYWSKQVSRPSPDSLVVQLLSRVWLFCDPMDCSPPGFSVHGISQARILELGCHFLLQGIFLTQGSVPHLFIDRRVLYHWATREVQPRLARGGGSCLSILIGGTAKPCCKGCADRNGRNLWTYFVTSYSLVL